MSSEPSTGPVGRPRSERSRVAVLDAAWALANEEGLRRLTIEAIAARAKVSKATIYRWWPNKSAVVMDALQRELDPAIPFGDSGSTIDDLRRQLAAVIQLLFFSRAGRIYRELIGASQHDPELASALAERYIASRREAAAAALKRGIDSGELRADLDPGLTIDALYGAVYYRLLVSQVPTEPAYADTLIAQFTPALTATNDT